MDELHAVLSPYAHSRYTRLAHAEALVAGAALPYLVYTGPTPPADTEARHALYCAYHSEILLRSRVWATRQIPALVERLPLRYRELRLSLPHFTYDEEDGLPSAEPLFHDLRTRLDQWHDLVVLGPPGSGKTTTLWNLASDLAHDALIGPAHVPLPILIALGIPMGHGNAQGLVHAALAHAVVTQLDGQHQPLLAHRLLSQLLPTMLAEERLVLLWDGLDESPRNLVGHTSAMIEALRIGATRRIQNVVTCRLGAYPPAGAYANGLHVTIKQVAIEPLDEPIVQQYTLSQLGDERGRALLQLRDQPAYATLLGSAHSPLLLTMLCVAYAALGHLPASRGRLVEAFVMLRLNAVDRRDAVDQSLVARLEYALAYLAYLLSARSGRGSAAPMDWVRQQLSAGDAARHAPLDRDLLSTNAAQASATADPAALLQHALVTGLLIPADDGEMLRFCNVLVQDYLAALVIGRLLRGTLTMPATAQEPGHLVCYPKVGWPRDWVASLLLLASLDGTDGQLRQPLGAALGEIVLPAARAIDTDPAMAEVGVLSQLRAVALVQIADTASTLHQRLEAGTALGLVADPRTPLSMTAWRNAVAQRGTRFGHPAGYWCYIPAGTYRVGGPDVGQERTAALDAYWIGLLPITVAQFSRFFEEGYGVQAQRWWTPQGWAWRMASQRTQPQHWDEPHYTGLSQPVIGVSWYEAAAYCSWLSEHLRDVLPTQLVVRLPTEAEWEVAAAFDGVSAQRPYPWGDDAPTVGHAIYNLAHQRAAAPVGCCPAGAAACGALDLVGNVEEWCASWYNTYPDASNQVVADPPAGPAVVLGPLSPQQLTIRGGWWAHDAAQLGCGRRFWQSASAASYTTGFRIVLAAPGSMR